MVPTSCEDEVVALLQGLRREEPRYTADGREEFFAAEQNALVVKDAEAYYRAMVRGGPQSWNIRDRHMTETLERLVRHHGPGARAIVWEHNTHIGDARYSGMVTSRRPPTRRSTTCSNGPRRRLRRSTRAEGDRPTICTAGGDTAGRPSATLGRAGDISWAHLRRAAAVTMAAGRRDSSLRSGK